MQTTPHYSVTSVPAAFHSPVRRCIQYSPYNGLLFKELSCDLYGWGIVTGTETALHRQGADNGSFNALGLNTKPSHPLHSSPGHFEPFLPMLTAVAPHSSPLRASPSACPVTWLKHSCKSRRQSTWFPQHGTLQWLHGIKPSPSHLSGLLPSQGDIFPLS